MTPGHRMSKLPITQYCGLAGKLGEEAGSIRPGVMSKWFHANCGEQWEEAQKLWLQLGDDEREEVKLWYPPVTVTLDGLLLEYKDAEKELEVALDDKGNYVDPTLGDYISLGHLDMAWVRQVSGGKRAYIGDIKRSRHTVKDSTNSLQLHAYGFAYSSRNGCNSYRVGIWQAMDGVWVWGSSVVDLESSAASDIWDRILHSATNVDESPNKGAHCQQCWGRMKCPAYTLPAALNGTAMEPLVKGELTPDKALEVLQLCEQMKDMAALGFDSIQRYVRAGGKVVDPVTGLTYKAVECNGKESISKGAFVKKYGLDYDVIKRGRPYQRWDWVKK